MHSSGLLSLHLIARKSPPAHLEVYNYLREHQGLLWCATLRPRGPCCEHTTRLAASGLARLYPVLESQWDQEVSSYILHSSTQGYDALQKEKAARAEASGRQLPWGIEKLKLYFYYCASSPSFVVGDLAGDLAGDR